jgi:hypothetical protein
VITVTLDNGQILHFPDGTPQNIMKSAIERNFPDQVHLPMGDVEKMVGQDANLIRQGRAPVNTHRPKSQSQIALEKFHDAFRNLGAGASESVYNATEGMKPILSLNNPSLLNSTRKPQFEDIFGVQETNPAIQKIPEMAASFIPGVGASGALSKAPALARALGLASEQTAVQGGLGYLFNPESREESAAKAGGTAGAIQLGLNALTSQNPIARAARYAAPRAIGGFAGEKAGEITGLPLPVRIALGLTGALGGGATANIIPKILGTRSMVAKNYAQEVLDAASNTRPRQLQVRQAAADRRGLRLTPGEITQDEVLLAKEGKAGKTEANVRLKNSLEEARKSKEAKINEEFRKGVYNPSQHKGAKQSAADSANMTKFPKNMIPKEHQHAYDLARNFARNDKNLSVALSKSRKGTIEEQDVLRRALDDMTKDKKGSTEQLVAARDALSKSLKNYSKDYKDFMMYSEREHLANDIKYLADKQKLSGKPFFKFIEGNKALNDALLHTRDVPGAKSFLKDANRIYGLRQDINADKLAKKLTEAQIPMSKSGAKAFLDRLFSGKSDKEIINMMYDPDIMKKVHSIANMNEPEKIIAEFSKVLLRKKAQDTARKDKEES